MRKFSIIHSLSNLSAAVLAAILFISSFISSPAAGDNNSKATSIRTNTVNEEYNEYALSESVTLNYSGNFTYMLDGDSMSWIGTSEF